MCAPAFIGRFSTQVSVPVLLHYRLNFFPRCAGVPKVFRDLACSFPSALREVRVPGVQRAARLRPPLARSRHEPPVSLVPAARSGLRANPPFARVLCFGSCHCLARSRCAANGHRCSRSEGRWIVSAVALRRDPDTSAAILARSRRFGPSLWFAKT